MTFGLGPALLFCPADRPERYAKALDRADAVIIDLEDAVAPGDKASAREALVAHQLDPERIIVRVNSAGRAPGGTSGSSDDFELDLEAIEQTGYRTIMLAKATTIPDELAAWSIVALCETAAGVLAAPALAAHDSVVALMWGAEDLVASLGGSSSRFPDGRYRDVAAHARSSVLLAAGAHGKAAIDSVYVDIPNAAGLEVEATDAAASGFAATACIHPSQVDTIRAAYRPTPEDLSYAADVIAASETERGVFRFRGTMVDEPLLAHARRILSRAQRP